MARKSVLVLVTGAAAAGIIATGAAAGAALTGGGSDEGFGVAVSSSPPGSSTRSDSATPPSGSATTPSDSVTPPSGDRTPADGPASKAPAAGAVSRGRAVDIALATTGGGTVVDTEGEWEHGRPAWKVEIVKGGVEHKVYVDRENGGIVKYDRDDDADGSSGKGRSGHDD